MKLDKSKIIPLLKEAIREDIGAKDITSYSVLHPDTCIKAYLLAKESGIVCGMEVAELIFDIVDRRIRFKPQVKDGDAISNDKILAYIEGPARTILSCERVALNFLCRLSGIATLTNEFVKKVSDTNAKIMDTRKTTPLLRELEKYAVICGGGFNHRMGLFDMVLIKDNHISVLASQSPVAEKKRFAIEETIKRARKYAPKAKKVEIEVNNLEEFKTALGAKPDIIMLDNMSIDDTKEAVSLARHSAIYRPLLEASGNVTVDNVREIALTGVDMISVGSLTHSAKAVDISLEIMS